MLHSSSDGVSHSMGNGSRGDMVSHSNGGSMVSNSNRSSGIASMMADSKGSSETVMSISISFSLSLSLPLMVSSVSNRSGSITQSVHNLLAHLLILNLFSSHNLSAAHFLGMRGASLSDQDDIFSDTVRSRSSVVGDGSNRGNGSMSIAKSLSISIS